MPKPILGLSFWIIETTIMEENLNEPIGPEQTQDNDRVIRVNIEEQMKTSYIDYSMSVIVGRALPDVRDGFKPVHRRVFVTNW